MKRLSVVALLLAGCGGGGGEDGSTAVSASPPPVVQQQPQQQQSPAPAPASPAPVAVVVPSPSPSDRPTAAQPVPSNPPGPTIPVATLATAMSTQTVDNYGPWGQAEPVGFVSAPVYVFQMPNYYLATGERYPDPSYAFKYKAMQIQVQGIFRDSISLASALSVKPGEADGPEEPIQLAGGSFNIPSSVDVSLNRGVLNRWSNSSGHFVEVSIAPAGEDNFSLCWEILVPTIDRTICMVYARADGAFKAISADDTVEGVTRVYREEES